MSQLLNSLDAVIQAAAKIKPGQRMSQVLNRYQQRQAGTPYRCVLADVSSSMDEMSGNLSKINVL